MLNDSAKRSNINNIISYDFEDLKGHHFYIKNKEILDQPKGIGYWLWKPYIILEAFKNLAEGDIVIYSDCGIEIIDDLTPLVEIAKTQTPIVLFGNANHLNYMWTKRDCFVLMDCDSERYWYSSHVDAAFSLFRKSSLSTTFLNDWIHFGQNKFIITDLPNSQGLDNIPGFQDHRWDQSILSLLAEKYQLPLFRMPTQFGNHYKIHQLRKKDEFNCPNQSEQQQVSYYYHIPYYNSNYPQLLNHHRTKKIKNDEVATVQQFTRLSASPKGILKKVVKGLLSKAGLKISRIKE